MDRRQFIKASGGFVAITANALAIPINYNPTDAHLTARQVAPDTETTGLTPVQGRQNEEIGSAERDDGEVTGRTFHTLPTGSLLPGLYRPRTDMDPGSLKELAASIKAQGLFPPISVRPVGNGRYEIVAGERRWRASQIAGLSEVPVVIREISDDKALATSLIENINRENLNLIEEAAGLQWLIDECGFTLQQAADAVGRSIPATSNLLRLLKLATPVRDMLMAGDIEIGHARALLSLPIAEQECIAKLVAKKSYSVRKTEELVVRSTNSTKTYRKEFKQGSGFC